MIENNQCKIGQRVYCRKIINGSIFAPARVIYNIFEDHIQTNIGNYLQKDLFFSREDAFKI
jgi:hypothetical protein